MAVEPDTDARRVAVDQRLAVWRQGDCVLGEYWFAHRFEPSFPVTESGRAATASDADTDLAEQQVAGLVVVTQTCDIVRSCTDRPFIEVCPLVEVNEQNLRQIEAGRRPGYGFIPSLAERNLVADLDRTMTVEKPVVAKWERTPGLSTDAQERSFAAALARKRCRFAFPDDFTALARNLQARLTEKHDKQSQEGRALRALTEIRVHAAPSWNSPTVTLMFWFVRPDKEADFDGESWSTLVERWLRLVPEAGRFVKVHGQVATLEDLTALDYVSSDRIDLDRLSSPKRGA